MRLLHVYRVKSGDSRIDSDPLPHFDLIARMRFPNRRIGSFFPWLVAAALVAGIYHVVRQQHDSLGHGAFTSGYVLSAAVIFLASFHGRKKLNFLPLGSATTWLRLHLVVAFSAIAIFLLHTRFRWPTGGLETTLYFLFAAVSASGVYGWYLSRTLPKKLSKLREEIIYERIPGFRTQVMRQAHEVVASLAAQSSAETVTDFFVDQLSVYFDQKRRWPYYVRPTSGMRNSLQSQLSRLERYCSDAEREAAKRLAKLIDQRDDLDYHAALQGKLKYWLFAHLGMTYMLLVVMGLHIVLAHAFFGGGL